MTSFGLSERRHRFRTNGEEKQMMQPGSYGEWPSSGVVLSLIHI